jgi:hypothetical protein
VASWCHQLAAKIVANPAIVTSGPIAEPQPHNQSETDHSFAGDLIAHHHPTGSAEGLSNGELTPPTLRGLEMSQSCTLAPAAAAAALAVAAAADADTGLDLVGSVLV